MQEGIQAGRREGRGPGRRAGGQAGSWAVEQAGRKECIWAGFYIASFEPAEGPLHPKASSFNFNGTS